MVGIGATKILGENYFKKFSFISRNFELEPFNGETPIPEVAATWP